MEKKKEDGNFGSDDFGFWSFAWLWVGGVMCGGSSRLGMGDWEQTLFYSLLLKTPLDGSTVPVEMDDLIKLSQGIKVAIGYSSFFNHQSVQTISRVNNSPEVIQTLWMMGNALT